VFGWLALALAVVVLGTCRGDLGGPGRRVPSTPLPRATPRRLAPVARGVERSRRGTISWGGTRG
jgi:hypothetical protein